MSYAISIYVNDRDVASACLAQQERDYLPIGTTDADVDAMRRDGCIAWTSVQDELGKVIGHALFANSASGAMEVDGTGCIRIDTLRGLDAAMATINEFVTSPPKSLYVNDIPPSFPATEKLLLQLGALRTLLVRGEDGAMCFEDSKGDWNISLVAAINRY